MKSFLFLITAVAAISILLSCAQRKEFSYTGYIMGGPCEIRYYCTNGGIASQTVSEIDDELRRLDSLLNFFSDRSFISELNRNHRAQATREILYLFVLSDSVSRLTAGLFDISIAPLMKIWGFYSRTQSIPAQASIESARQKVDYRRIRIVGDSIFLPDEMMVDVGGIAQGYAADRVADIIRKYEIPAAIINIAGEIVAVGESPEGRPWRVGIRNPRGEGIVESIELTNGALSTSGDYEKFFVVDNKRYPHILDPHTGCPAQEFASVTIISQKAAFADAIATAVAVMGATRGLRFLDSLRIKGIIYFEKNNVLERIANR